MAIDEAPETAREGARAATISNGIVRLYRERHGRGPTRAKTYFLPDLVCVVLEGGSTTVERTLCESGREDLVHNVRRAFHAAVERQFVELVEAVTGRRVETLLSQYDTDADVSVELFILEPAADP